MTRTARPNSGKNDGKTFPTSLKLFNLHFVLISKKNIAHHTCSCNFCYPSIRKKMLCNLILVIACCVVSCTSASQPVVKPGNVTPELARDLRCGGITAAYRADMAAAFVTFTKESAQVICVQAEDLSCPKCPDAEAATARFQISLN